MLLQLCLHLGMSAALEKQLQGGIQLQPASGLAGQETTISLIGAPALSLAKLVKDRGGAGCEGAANSTIGQRNQLHTAEISSILKSHVL